MKARRPSLDFTHAPARWIPDAPAYAYQLDAASTMLPYLEPYLIRVQKLAREQLDPARQADLIRAIDLFNQQEANHYRLHARYNEVLRQHYPGLEVFEAEIKADFDRFLREKSLAWNLAYCEGFECTGLVSAEFFFGPAEPFLRTADPSARDLWAWHLAEEFEHRSVCHDVLRALHPGLVRRLLGYYDFLTHLQRYGNRVAAYLASVDRERGTLPADAEAKNRAFDRVRNRFMLPRLARILLPTYDPAPRAMALSLEAALLHYESR
jgi:predicted metal-dependent hydrolase